MAPRCLPSFGFGEICGIDIDDALSHDIPKVVKIRDARLGCLYYLLVSGAVGWIVVYQLLYNLRYLHFFEPNLSPVRITLQQPTAGGCSPKYKDCRDMLPRIPDLPYCCTEDCSIVKDGFCKCPGETRPRCHCEYVDGFASSYIQESSVFITTIDTEYNQVFNSSCNNSAIDGCDKLWLSVSRPRMHCVAGIENYTLMLDHTLQQDDLGVTQRAAEMRGYLFVDGTNPIQQALCKRTPDAVSNFHVQDLTNQAPCFILPRYVTNGTENILDIGTMMESMGVTLDSMSSQFEGGNDDSLRFSGITVTIQINYFNTRPWLGLMGTRAFFYKLVPGSVDHFRHTEVVWRRYPNERHIREAHGLHFSVMPTGYVADFDFNMLIITVTTGLTLLAAAGAGVRFLALTVMRHRSYYKRMVFQKSCDFSDVCALEALSEKEFSDLLHSRHLSENGTREAKVLRLLADGFQVSELPSPMNPPAAMAAAASLKNLTASFGFGGMGSFDDSADAASSCSKLGIGKSTSFGGESDCSGKPMEDNPMETTLDCGELHDLHSRLASLEAALAESAARSLRRLAGPELDILRLPAGRLRIWLPLCEPGVAVSVELSPLFDASGSRLFAVQLPLPTGVRLVQQGPPPGSAHAGDGADGVVAILDVTPHGAAAAAGVLPGDVVRAVSCPPSPGRGDGACPSRTVLRCDGLSMASVVQAVQSNAQLSCRGVTFCLERPSVPLAPQNN